MNREFLTRLQDEVADLQRLARFRELRDIECMEHGQAVYEGGKLWNFSGNDYLGVAGDLKLRQSFFGTLNQPTATWQRWGNSAASSRLLTGNHNAYRELETKLSSWYNGRAALVFNSGYHANIGILPALAGKGDLILSDKLNHASIIDGLRLGEAEFKRYRHLDYSQLEQLLIQAQGRYRQIFVITESIFSMDGDVADLKLLCELKARFGAFLLVDEAHSVGVRGVSGGGLAEELGVLDQVDMIIGTFGKALGGTGAYGIMEPVVREYLINRMRPLIFTTGLPPVVINWNSFAVDRVQAMTGARERLQSWGERLRQIIVSHGYETDGSSQIVPLLVGDDERCVKLAAKLRESGILVFAIRPPTVPAGTSRLRFSLNAALPEVAFEQLNKALKL